MLTPATDCNQVPVVSVRETPDIHICCCSSTTVEMFYWHHKSTLLVQHCLHISSLQAEARVYDLQNRCDLTLRMPELSPVQRIATNCHPCGHLLRLNSQCFTLTYRCEIHLEKRSASPF